MTRMLVVGSCTGDKDAKGCLAPLTQAELCDASTRENRERDLREWIRPAAQMYKGQQHRFMMNGVATLRAVHGAAACDVSIISAGYGLVTEEQPLAPYETTFQKMRRAAVVERANRLGIPAAVRRAMADYPIVVFLLGKEYLWSIAPPLVPHDRQRLVFFSSSDELRTTRSTTVVPAGKDETRYGAGQISVKGKMFELMALGLVARPDLWPSLLADESPRTICQLLDTGQRSA